MEKLEYASFWRRLIAFIIDTFFVLCLLIPFGFMPMDQIGLVLIIVQIIYYTGFEGSFKQATPGKQFLKIKVTTLKGERVAYWRSFLRILVFTAIPVLVSFIYGLILGTKIPDLNVSMFVYTAPFVVYVFMIFVTQKKQSLHDMITGCLVVRNARED